MSVIQINLLTVSNYTLLLGKSPWIPQNFMNFNDNKTNRQGYDFHHDDTVIGATFLDVGYLAAMQEVLTCRTDPIEEITGRIIMQVMNLTYDLGSGSYTHKL